ncbi:MAG: hypothetical protein ACFBRM_13800 [Pikeienuella sp.]
MLKITTALPAALLALGLLAGGAGPAAADTDAAPSGILAQVAAAAPPVARAPSETDPLLLIAQANPESAAAPATDTASQAPQPEPQADPAPGSEPEADAKAADTSPRPMPRVYWYDTPRGLYGYGPDAFQRPDLEWRLEEARRRLDDSQRFPARGHVYWRYDPATGDYYYYANGRWYLAPRQHGYYDRSGNWRPSGWHDGRWRTGPGYGRGYPPAPCGCGGW